MTSLIPANIITGFLGVGKTTAILHLLEHKPANETWAVLVNEFGEVGIDGALLRQSGAYVREIPGGCMCCVTGVPMQVGLTRLLREARPHRLLIEPTGLGHPAQIIKTLTGAPFDQLLELRATVTLVDPRRLSDPRYLANGNFRDQLAVADVLVANKSDLCSPGDMEAFNAFVGSQADSPSVAKVTVNGALNVEWLDQPARDGDVRYHHHHESEALANQFDRLATPEDIGGITRKENKGQGFSSCGWVFHPAQVFSYDKLFNWLTGLKCDRLKGVMITDRGIAALNADAGVLKIMELDDCLDSRLEVINHQPMDWDELSQQIQQLYV